MFYLTGATCLFYENTMREMDREKLINDLLRIQTLHDTLLNFKGYLENMNDRDLKSFHKRFAKQEKKSIDIPHQTPS
jgi:hypothetical protein